MEEYAKKERVPIINEKGKNVLVSVLKKHRPKSVLEIGTAIGYSALLAAVHGAENAAITTLELSSERVKRAREFIARSPYEKKIELIEGDAAEILATLAGKYDFVFIDAAKGQYPHYLELVEPLLAKNAVIVADNVLFRGYVKGSEKPPRRYKTIVARLRRYIELVSQPPFRTKIYEDGDGLAVSYYER
jgi:predicted O-methyltransferase YrrM